MGAFTTIIYIIILILSVVIHEVAHGYMADWLGDPTPRLAGRLTLNPIKHLDLMGSIVLPLVLILIGSPFLIGWAKPVPFNPYNFKRFRRWGGALVAVAGPMSNVVLAVIFGLLARFGPAMGIASDSGFLAIARMIALLNIVLTIFNLLPIPPLDGHHILFAALPATYHKLKMIMTKYSIVIFLVVFFVLWRWIEPLIFIIYDALVGEQALQLLTYFMT